MITNKPSEKVIPYESPRQRLGNKTLFTNITKNQNNLNVRYFSGIDAEIYFEDIYIDETVQISFTVQQQSLPLYGYNSYVFDDIALGSRIVQGQFTINFTKSNYMYQVLDTLAGMRNGNKIEKSKMIDSHQPLWNRTFNIYMSYGDAKQNDRVANSTILMLKQVSLTSCGQDLDYTGKPIYETYSFVAKDIDFITEGQYKDDTAQVAVKIEPLTAINYSILSKNKVDLNFLFAEGIKVKTLAYKPSGISYYIMAYRATDLPDCITAQLTTEVEPDISNKISSMYENTGKSPDMSVMIEYLDVNDVTKKDEVVMQMNKIN